MHGVQNLTCGFVNYLNDGSCLAIGDQRRQMTGYGAPIVSANRNGDRPSWILTRRTLIDCGEPGPTFKRDCLLSLVKTNDPESVAASFSF